MKRLWTAALVSVGMMMAAPAMAATQIVNSSGKLTGAKGVIVDGTSYDVSFLDGTCDQVYGACTRSSFDFSTQASANNAALALLSQVLIDTTYGMFDSDPSVTQGCSSNFLCRSLIAFDSPAVGNTSVVLVNNYAAYVGSNNVGSGVTLGNYDTSQNISVNFARFFVSSDITPQSAVPEAATWAMMIFGFGLVGGAMRRRKPAVATRVFYAV